MRTRISIFGIQIPVAHVALLFLGLVLTAIAVWRPEVLVALLFVKGGFAMATVFPSNNCSGRLINVDASTGCTLTRASIVGLTPEAFGALGFQEIGMQQAYAKAREARVAGYLESNLTTLLNSRIKNMKDSLTIQKIPGNPSVILPYFPMRQRRNINSNYWKVTAGAPNPQAGTGDTPSHAIDITVTNNPSSLATTLVNLDQYFLPGKVLFVEYATSANVSKSLQYKILSAATVGGVTKVTGTPNYTEAGWAGLSAGDKLAFQIGGASGGNAEAGTIAYLGVNSVSDFESWGGQDPAENNMSLLNFWPQTSRIVHEYTDEYLKALNACLDPSVTNSYLAMFRQLPLAEQRRIQRAKYERDKLNTAFFGQVIDENQTTELYTRLPKVYDPTQPTCVLEYKANALGFKTQLNTCGRVLDHSGNPLNLDSLFSTLYLVKKARQADNSIGLDDEPVIDVITDPVTAGQVRDLMISFYRAKYGAEINRYYTANETLKFEDQVMFKYNTYQIPDELGGYKLAVFSSEFFRDRLAAASGSNRQRYVWVIDWSDVTLGVLGTNSAVRRTNEADNTFMYTPKINIKHVTLDSETWCPIMEDPNRHYAVENFANTCPVLTVTGCTV